MSPTSATLGTDHLDLLVTAACHWRILTSRTAAAFSRAEAHLVVAGATEAGRMGFVKFSGPTCRHEFRLHPLG